MKKAIVSGGPVVVGTSSPLTIQLLVAEFMIGQEI